VSVPSCDFERDGVTCGQRGAYPYVSRGDHIVGFFATVLVTPRASSRASRSSCRPGRNWRSYGRSSIGRLVAHDAGGGGRSRSAVF